MTDLTKPVQTRSGFPARVICTDRRGGRSSTPVLALVEQENGCEVAHYYTAEGKVFGASADHYLDLVNTPEVRYEYQNVYKNRGVSSHRFDTLEMCLSAAHNNAAVLYGYNEYKIVDDEIESVTFVRKVK